MNYSNNLSMLSSSSLPYSSSSEYSRSFSMLPLTFHIFWQFPSYLQNSDDPVCAFLQEYITVLHFKTKKKSFIGSTWCFQKDSGVGGSFWLFKYFISSSAVSNDFNFSCFNFGIEFLN